MLDKFVKWLQEKIVSMLYGKSESLKMQQHVLTKLYKGLPLQVKDIHEMKYSQTDMKIICEHLLMREFIKIWDTSKKANKNTSPFYQITKEGKSYLDSLN